MQTPWLARLAALLLVASPLAAQTITDNFSGASLNTSLWTASAFDGHSSYTVNNGLTLTDREHLTSVATFAGPLTISGTVTFNDASDLFSIAFRFDGNYSGSFGHNTNGLLFTFGPRTDQVAFGEPTPTDPNPLQTSLFDFVTGTPYDFTLTDNGSVATFYINNTLQLSATSAVDTGDYVGFYNREWIGTDNTVQVGSLSVSAVPEPAAWSAIAGLAALGAIGLRQRTKRPA